MGEVPENFHGVKGKSGRKSAREEIQLIRRMTELSEPVFKYLRLCIESGDKVDKQWGVEQMMKLYPKAIPTELATDPDNPVGIQIVIAKEVSEKYNVAPSPESNSEGQPSV